MSANKMFRAWAVVFVILLGIALFDPDSTSRVAWPVSYVACFAVGYWYREARAVEQLTQWFTGWIAGQIRTLDHPLLPPEKPCPDDQIV
jgi:hypothetical protein